MVQERSVILTNHALDRKSERNIDISLIDGRYYINNKEIKIEKINKLPYVKDNGCFKYYDFNNCVSWYVRDNKIMTIVKYEKIAIFRRIITDVYNLKFNDFCRDHIFGTCKRGANCRYKHINMNKICNHCKY